MAVTSDVFCSMLLSAYGGSQYGRDLGGTGLLMPRPYREGMTLRPGGIYVAADDPPTDTKTPCLIICSGPNSRGAWKLSRQRILALDGTDPDMALQDAMDIYERISSWEALMQTRILDGAEIPDLVEATLPLLDNSITVTDHDLRFIAYCELGPDGHPHLSEEESRVPVESLPYLSSELGSLMRNHDPFFFEDEGGNLNYCINVFSGSSYVGCCSIESDAHPFQDFELALFRRFAGFIETSISLHARKRKPRTPTLEILITGMLGGSRPNSRDLQRSLEMFLEGNCLPYDSPLSWVCAVIPESNHVGGLSSGYLLDELRQRLARSVIVEKDDSLVAFILSSTSDRQEEAAAGELRPLLENLGLDAGISRPFSDISLARLLFLQAQAALITGNDCHLEERCHLFSECELDYLLGCCTRELGTAALIPPELVELSHIGENGVDYVGTLRTYLDCDCNASRAAEHLYLHRSTMVQRLERIREVVDLDDERKKLLLRIVLHLADLSWAIMQQR